ncbi:hypothetical protein PFDG_04914, partial [Plasmodium falciparum Dd2]
RPNPALFQTASFPGAVLLHFVDLYKVRLEESRSRERGVCGRYTNPYEGKRHSISYNRMMTPNLYTGFKRNINNINYRNNFLLSSNVS